MQILKVISRLLSYPTPELFAHADEVAEAISNARELPSSLRQQILAHFNNLCAVELMDTQQEYSELFDHGRSLSLLLFEHVHGDSRDRGQAMVDLMAVYQQNGFAINVRELPDHLPLYLEYLAQRPEDEVREWLADVSHILGLLSARLQERDSNFYLLLDALLVISRVNVDVDELRETAAAEERDDTMEAFDKVWEEEAVRFGADDNAAGCTPQKVPQRDQSQPLHWVDASGASASPLQN